MNQIQSLNMATCLLMAIEASQLFFCTFVFISCVVIEVSQTFWIARSFIRPSATKVSFYI